MVAVEPTVTKKVRFEADPDVRKNEPIAWGLRFLDLGGEWGWLRLRADHADELRRALAAMEGETLHALEWDKRVKRIPASDMRRGAQQRLGEIDLEEADTLWELRLPNKWRAWGLVEGSTFYFLWWDEYETACGPPPKGTVRR